MPIRAAAATGDRTSTRTRLATMISTAQNAVAAAMSVSPVPQPTPVGAWMRSWLASSTPMATTCSRPRRSPRNRTARMATHTNSVLWITAAAGAVASARPVKKRTKGTLPPRTPSATSPGTDPALRHPWATHDGQRHRHEERPQRRRS